MKKLSKNNYSKKNNENYKIRSRNKNQNKTTNSQVKRNSFQNNNNVTAQNNTKKIKNIKNSEYTNINLKDNTKNVQNKKNGRFISDGHRSKNLSKNDKTLNQNNFIDKNFDDWIWGKHSVLAALNSKRPINRIWCTSDIFSSEKFYLLLKDFKSNGVLIEEVSWSRLSQLTHGAVHQGVALQLASSKTVSLNELIDRSKSKFSKPIIVALDGITDPHNLGAIIRSAEAFDCKGIIIPQRRSAGLTGTVAKVSAGALEHISVCRVVNLNRAIDELKKNEFTIVGLSGDGQTPITEFKENVPTVVIVGSEGKGISLITQKKCDYLLKIPLAGKTSSLNASVASAISFYHLSNN